MVKFRTFYLPEAAKANTDTKVPIMRVEHVGPKTYYFSASLEWIWDPKWEGHGAFQIWLRYKEGSGPEIEEFITHTVPNERIFITRFEGYQNGFYIDFMKTGDKVNKPQYNIRILYKQFRPAKVNLTVGEAHNGLKAIFED